MQLSNHKFRSAISHILYTTHFARTRRIANMLFMISLLINPSYSVIYDQLYQSNTSYSVIVAHLKSEMSQLSTELNETSLDQIIQRICTIHDSSLLSNEQYTREWPTLLGRGREIHDFVFSKKHQNITRRIKRALMLTHKDWEDWALNRFDAEDLSDGWSAFYICWSGVSRQVLEFVVNGARQDPRQQALVLLYNQFWKYLSARTDIMLPPFELLHNSSKAAWARGYVDSWGLALIHPSHLEHDWVVDDPVCIPSLISLSRTCTSRANFRIVSLVVSASRWKAGKSRVISRMSILIMMSWEMLGGMHGFLT